MFIRTNPHFIPKVPTDFHLNEPIVLKSYFPNPTTAAEKSLHSWDVKRCLKLYIEKTKTFRKSDQLFVAFAHPRKGQALMR